MNKGNTPATDNLNWRTMTREELDRALNNSDAVPERIELFKVWDQKSAELRAKYPQFLDLKYGPRPRNRLDFFKIADAAPTLLFIHGGYWQMHSKERFAYFATGPMAHGINVAVIEYTLAPEVTLNEVTAEIHAGLNFMVANAKKLGIDTSRIAVTGSSAGGHLTAMALTHPNVKGGVGMSGLYDLEPIEHSYLNANLHLDDTMMLEESPTLQNQGAKTPICLVVGSAELPMLRKETADFALHRIQLKLPVSYEEIPGANHFTMLQHLASPTGRITTLVRQLLM